MPVVIFSNWHGWATWKWYFTFGMLSIDSSLSTSSQCLFAFMIDSWLNGREGHGFCIRFIATCFDIILIWTFIVWFGQSIAHRIFGRIRCRIVIFLCTFDVKMTFWVNMWFQNRRLLFDFGFLRQKVGFDLMDRGQLLGWQGHFILFKLMKNIGQKTNFLLKTLLNWSLGWKEHFIHAKKTFLLFSVSCSSLAAGDLFLNGSVQTIKTNCCI